MSTAPSTSTSQSNFTSIFNASLESYKRKTKNDLASHPLLPSLQSCKSPEDVLAVLKDQVPAFNQPQDGDDRLTEWVTPTVNVLYSFSGTIGQGVGLAFPPASVIFAGIGVLLSAAKDATTSQDKLIDIFNRIGHFFHRLEIYTSFTPTTAMSDIIVEIMVEVLTTLAIATKEAKRGLFKKYVKKLVGNTEIEDSLGRLDRLTQEEARMASAEQLKMTHSVDDRVRGVEGQVEGVRDDLQGVRGNMQDVGNKVQDVDDRVQSIDNNVRGVDHKVQSIDNNVRGVDDKLDQANRKQLRDSLLRWLSPPNPSTNHNLACKAHHNGTTQWFFRGDIFNQWKSTGDFLWVHGKPGSGKSVVCSSIIQDVMASCDNGQASLAYFYFDFRDVDKQNMRNLLPSLLIQLSARSDPCCDLLSRLYSKHDCGVKKPSDSAMIECLKEMLTQAQQPIYIIIDALDECPTKSSIPSPREEVLELVEDLVGLHLPHLHICVTSRPEPDIQIALERLTECPVSLHDETGQTEDIANYVSSSVHSDRRMGRWREEDKNLVIKTLSEKADGMFRWAFCQLELLRHCFPPSVRRILEELPDSLDETYERILREIRKPNQGHAHRILQCLVVAVRPLKVEELAEVLAFDFDTGGMPKLNADWRWEDQEEAVMSACSSLVTIVKNGDSRVVQFSHFSVKEFLTANRLAEPMRDVTRYHIRLEAAHTVLAQACLGVLLRLDDHVDRESIQNFPLARYAAEYWPTHARVENVSLCIKDGMERLFDAEKGHFSMWLWIHDDSSYPPIFTAHPEKPEAVPLYYAAKLGFRDLAEHLIGKYPEHVNARRDVFHDTPMHAAALAGHTNILSLLTEHGADVNVRNMSGDTPLHEVSTNGRLEAGRFLLDSGANINIGSNYNYTPLSYAARRGYMEFAQMLIERGALIDLPNNGGETPLHLAAGSGKTQVVRLLLEHGADVNAREKFGKTPSQLASDNGDHAVVELLSEHGAEPVAMCPSVYSSRRSSDIMSEQSVAHIADN